MAAAAIPLVVGPNPGNPFYDYLIGTLLLPHELTVKLFEEGLQDFETLIHVGFTTPKNPS
jgi:hypothetical protein